MKTRIKVKAYIRRPKEFDESQIIEKNDYINLIATIEPQVYNFNIITFSFVDNDEKMRFENNYKYNRIQFYTQGTTHPWETNCISNKYMANSILGDKIDTRRGVFICVE